MLVANGSYSLVHPVSSQREELRQIFESRKLKRKIHDTLVFASSPSNNFCNLSAGVSSGDFRSGRFQKIPKMTRSDKEPIPSNHTDIKTNFSFDSGEIFSGCPTLPTYALSESKEKKDIMQSQEPFHICVGSSDSDGRDPTVEEVSYFRSVLSERPSLSCWTNEETRKRLLGIALNIVRWLANKEHKASPRRKAVANICKEAVFIDSSKNLYSADDFDLRSLADFFIFECNKLELFNRTKAELSQHGDQRSLQDMLVSKNEFFGLPPSPPSGSQ